MDKKELGSIVANGKFYTPKYWVMKWNHLDDVVIETASKSLHISQRLAEERFTEKCLEDTSKYEFISIEIKASTVHN